MARTYCVTFQVVTPESAEQGDYAESGFCADGNTSYHVETPNEASHGEAFAAWRARQDFDVSVDPLDFGGYYTNPQPGDDPSVSESEACCQVMAEVLRRAGARLDSPRSFRPGDWYETEPEQNFRDGSYTSYHYHLDGWTPEEERRVCELVHSKG